MISTSFLILTLSLSHLRDECPSLTRTTQNWRWNVRDRETERVRESVCVCVLVSLSLSSRLSWPPPPINTLLCIHTRLSDLRAGEFFLKEEEEIHRPRRFFSSLSISLTLFVLSSRHTRACKRMPVHCFSRAKKIRPQ